MGYLPFAQDAFNDAEPIAVGVEAVTRRVDDDPDAEPVQRRDRDKRPLWRVKVVYQSPEGGREELLRVQIASHDAPVVTPGPVRFGGMRLRTWEMGDRAGYTLSAETYTQAPPPQPTPAKRSKTPPTPGPGTERLA